MPRGVYPRADSDHWPEHRVAILRRLWAAGLTASECAAELGGNITRCAVTGKIKRLGLTHSRPGLTSARARQMKNARAKVAPPARRKIPVSLSTPIRVKPAPATSKPVNTFDASPASQAAAALLDRAYRREGLSL